MAATELFYQAIQKVPGLTGTRYQDKGRDLYYKLGAPYGEYKGNLQQNSWLLGQINQNNYFSTSQPWNASTQSTAPTQGAMEDIGDATLNGVKPIGNFQDVMPQELWNSVFDEWTRNFVNEYVLPEWKQKTYDKQMEEAAMALGSLNKQMGVSGAYRSGTARGSLNRAVDQSVEQEAQLRQDYQSQIAALRDQIRNNWATPLYNSQQTQYTNTPWADMNFDNIGNDMENDLSNEYGVTNVDKLGELISGLNYTPGTPVDIPTYDWSAPQGDLSLINQYKLS